MAAGDRAVVEAIIRVRDEATKEFAAITKNISGQAQGLQQQASALQRLGLGAEEGQIAKMDAQLKRLVGTSNEVKTSTVGMSANFVGLLGAVGAAGVAFSAYATALGDAAREQAQFNRAMEGFSPEPFIAGVRQANDELATMVEYAKTVPGTLVYGIGELGRGLKRILGIGGKSPEQKRDENLAEARRRAGLADNEADNRARLEALRLEQQEAARIGGDQIAILQKRLALEQKILESRQELARGARTEIGGATQQLLGAQARERANLATRYGAEQAQIQDRLAREEEQRLAKQVTANEQAAREVARAWEQSLAARERAARSLAAAEQELEAARRARYQETVSGLPGLAAEQQRIAGQPGASGIRHAEMAAELASLQQEAAAIQKEDRRRAIADREQLAQENVEKLSGDFAKADAAVEKATGRLKQFNAELKNMQVSQGFVERFSQALADLLVFQGQREP